jgi:hypothetical protein
MALLELPRVHGEETYIAVRVAMALADVIIRVIPAAHPGVSVARAIGPVRREVSAEAVAIILSIQSASPGKFAARVIVPVGSEPWATVRAVDIYCSPGGNGPGGCY